MTAQGDRTKDLLIKATITLVAQVGYHQATTRAIAKLAGVAEGTLYRHFPDKRSLFFAAVLTGHRPLLDWMTDLPQRAGTAPLADTLVECLTPLWQLRETVVPLELAVAADPEFATLSPAERDLPALAAPVAPHRCSPTTWPPNNTSAGSDPMSTLRSSQSSCSPPSSASP